MCGVGGHNCSGIGVSLGWVVVPWSSLRRLIMIILVGLLLPECLVSCVLHFTYYVLRFAKMS